MSHIRDAFAGALSAYIDIAGEAVTYDDGSDTRTIKAIVSGSSVDVGGGEGARVKSVSNNILVAVSDLSAAAQAAVEERSGVTIRTHRITMRGDLYRPNSAAPDAEGGAVLVLKKVSS